jgi:DNA helicase-2/ATP-dependent DNA helicase PcrA
MEGTRAAYAELRRKIIASEFSSLNDMQREAVLATEGPLLLLAGAGSGKTTVLINRVANLLRYGRGSDSDEIPRWIGEDALDKLRAVNEGSAPVTEEIRALCAVEPPAPWQILTITFTNKAADELKSRLENKLGAEARDVWALTFHGACVRILRRDADRLGFPKSFTIYDRADSLAVMKRVLKDMNIDEKTYPPNAMLSAAERYKNSLVSAETAVFTEERTGDIRRLRTAQIYAAYAARLRDAGAMDFDDLLYYCVRLLQENPDVLSYFQTKFRYVLIDEYQDTNHLQYLFASMLAGGYRNICVVGDDDQSIYKFRGATIENILSFENQYTDARVIRLEQNYRSTGNILRAANAVIANNTQRKGKRLWTDKGTGEKITLYVAQNEDDEADFVSRIIKTAKRPARDFAVLYRTNAQSRSLETAFRRFGLSYKVFGGTRFYDRAEVKDILAYLSVVANPTDETRLLRIVNEPPRKIGQASIDRALAYAREENVSLFQVMSSASSRKDIAAGKRMEEFCRMIGELQELVSQVELDEFYDVLLERSGYLTALQSKGGDENLARIENIRELKTTIVKNVEATGGDLYSFLDEAALYTDMDSYDRNADAAVMMTMHSAKGLEFPVVFIVGAEEGLFPGSMAIGDPDEMEEERRLCYVAVTRAREKLYITCAAQRMLYGRTNANLPSRFTEEIPSELIERRGAARKREEQRSYWDDDGSFRYLGDFTAYRGRQQPPHRPAAQTRTRSVVQTAKKTAPASDTGKKESFAVGDRIVHRAFGKGVITKSTPMGGDALLEVRFDSGETKKLMLRIAQQQMEKENGAS